MAVSAVNSRHGNLPADLTTFVGRRHELADVRARLSSSRLVTLTGVGGVGKTRLALRVARDVRRGFPDGVWLVELAGLRDPQLVGQTLAASLGLHDRSASWSLTWLSDHLAERQMLLVLDNCEHLLSACAVLSNAILRACPGVRILATSRQPLRIDGEQLVAVPPLSAPPAGRPTFPGVATYEAVSLFVQRATAVHPGFRIGSDNEAVVAAICRRLDGVPLAVELAASRMRALSVDELMARLDDRYKLLTGGSRAALPRQQSLRALVDWSYDLCSDSERMAWARLSVFAGGFDLVTAERVCSDEAIPSDGVWDIVTHLVDKSIVVASDDAAGVRYQLTETLREYGQDRLREFGQTDDLKARHRDWARQLISQAEAGWFGAEQVPMFARLRREHANIREALSFCLRSQAEAEIGLEMASALRFYWVVSGRLKEGRHWIEQFLAACDQPGRARLKAMCVAGYLTTLVSDFPAADNLVREAGVLGARLGDSSGAALAIQVEALTALYQNDLERAAPLLRRALDSHREMRDEAAAIYDQIALALCTALLGDADRATDLLRDCLTVTQSRGEHWLRALALWALGIEQCKRGDYNGAESSELASLRLRVTLDDRWSIGLNLQVLGWVSAATGNGERAARLLGASEGIAQSVGLSPDALGYLIDLQNSYEGIGRRELTDEKFRRLHEEGRQMAFGDLAEFALGNEHRPAPSRTPVSSEPVRGLLTKRETEVAELVSRGMNNKDIAAALVISHRTAETHVQNILMKLGMTSRTQLATWVISNQAASED